MASTELQVNLNIEELPAVKATIERLQAERDEAHTRLADVSRHVDEVAALVRRGDTRHAIRTAVADLRRAVDGGPHGE